MMKTVHYRKALQGAASIILLRLKTFDLQIDDRTRKELQVFADGETKSGSIYAEVPVGDDSRLTVTLSVTLSINNTTDFKMKVDLTWPSTHVPAEEAKRFAKTVERVSRIAEAIEKRFANASLSA